MGDLGKWITPLFPGFLIDKMRSFDSLDFQSISQFLNNVTGQEKRVITLLYPLMGEYVTPGL